MYNFTYLLTTNYTMIYLINFCINNTRAVAILIQILKSHFDSKFLILQFFLVKFLSILIPSLRTQNARNFEI